MGLLCFRGTFDYICGVNFHQINSEANCDTDGDLCRGDFVVFRDRFSRDRNGDNSDCDDN